MNRSSLKVVFSFSIIIQLIAIFLYYVTMPYEASFFPIVVSFCCGMIVTICSVFSYRKKAIEDGFSINAPLVLGIYGSTAFVLILIRTIIVIVTLVNS